MALPSSATIEKWPPDRHPKKIAEKMYPEVANPEAKALPKKWDSACALPAVKFQRTCSRT